MQRLHDWPERLAAFIEARRERAFSWGESDCCLFVCDGIEAMTGTDPGERWRGLYQSERGARRVLRDNGGVSGLATLILGHPVPPALAGRGDVVVIDTPAGEALALCVGANIAAQGEWGLEFHPSSAARASWKV
ncbi:MAG: hypothetical protein INH12_31060 [Cupriavidus sp.]|uniref:DUF6950 family protein n=1 Tax=Cupriavidus sp. TaxID=1873897 RepID=UPI0025BECF06|nr:hypothetical protein [Cupriavidus sp.]MCA3194500.1 hypothetical protein [Cupriavidus sp.]MCA3761507.1 hypothetical protein [Cutibacterium sp.]